MTPKEKAEELFYNFDLQLIEFEGDIKYAAKQCALIVVDEIREVLPMYQGGLSDKYVYWQEVKQEIEKL